MSPAELGPDQDCAGETQQQLQTIHQSSRQICRLVIKNLQLSKDIFKKMKIKMGPGLQMMVMCPARLGPEKDCAREGQQQL
jgi:hypothetical protein